MISNKIINSLNGSPVIPGDKSISHRSVIIPSISNGISVINNYLKSEDVINTIKAFRSMGVKIIEEDEKLIIFGKGLSSLKKPNKEIYLGNSGTSSRRGRGHGERGPAGGRGPGELCGVPPSAHRGNQVQGPALRAPAAHAHRAPHG